MFHRFLFVAAVMIALAAPSSAQPKPPARIIVPRFPWVASLDAAKTTAKAADVPVLVYLYFPNHAACQNFEESVFTDEKFQELSALFVMVRVDAGLHKDVAQAFGVQRCPSLVFLDSGGVKLYLLDSKMDAKRVLSYMGRSILVSMYNAGKRARGAGDLRTATSCFSPWAKGLPPPHGPAATSARSPPTAPRNSPRPGSPSTPWTT